MLRILKNNKAQANVAEYLLTFMLVATAAAMMTVYFRRAFQAKIFDAERAMIATAVNRTGNHYRGNWLLQYEPYYFNTASTVTRDDSIRSQLNRTAFTTTYNTRASTQTSSDTASPRFYMNNLPTTYAVRNDLIPLP